MSSTTLCIPGRFMGPPGSANGGYLAGRLAALVACSPGESVTVTLRSPAPLEVALRVERMSADGAPTVRLHIGSTLVAEASLGDLDLVPAAPVDLAVAHAARAHYAGVVGHPFPGCYVCGSDRTDGLGLRPGPVPGRPGTVATSWEPGPDVGAETVWAALDCPSGWALETPGRPAVLGRITARVNGVPPVGGTCVVVGWLLGHDGRKAFSASALFHDG
ncbi:MAG TPA: hypothetical protein VNE21_05065, partial [Mycobacteriales bacterium]|nr:hypothetical protein [Mycobacteriales bacterium]